MRSTLVALVSGLLVIASCASTDNLTGGSRCSVGLADCDRDGACETKLAESLANCGSCGSRCNARPNSVATCREGRCSSVCRAGFGDCDGNLDNGCETSLSLPTSCGACATVCPEACVDGRCTIPRGCTTECTAPPSAGGAGGQCVNTACVYPTSCSDLLQRHPDAPSGPYAIDPGGTGKPFKAHCEMVGDGGGWTLALKVNGELATFDYDAKAMWETEQTHQPDKVDLDQTEAKLETFSRVSFTNVRIGMAVGTAAPRWLVLPTKAASLLALFQSSPRVSTNVGPSAWKGLVASAALQPLCNQEGFNNVGVRDHKVRIGIISNEQGPPVECDTPDSWLGIGHNSRDSNRCGNYAADNTAPEGPKNLRTTGFVMVR